MDIESYFQPALAFGRLIQRLHSCTGEERRQLQEQILTSPYLQNLQTMQSISNADFIQSAFPDRQINTMRRGYIINPAVPSMDCQENGQTHFASGYHRHDYYEIVVVLQGRYIQYVSGVRYLHTEGDICLLTPSILHREEGFSHLDRTLFIGISRDFFEGGSILRDWPELQRFLLDAAAAQNQRFLCVHLQDMSSVLSLLEQILQEDRDKLRGHHLIIKGCIQRFLDLVIRQGNVEQIEQSHADQRQALSNEIVRYMQTHMATVSREQTAEFFHFNPDYLNRYLKMETGRTYTETLKDLRMHCAAELLLAGNSTADTMQAIGLSNKGHFNRMFQETYGVLPGTFKRTRE